MNDAEPSPQEDSALRGDPSEGPDYLRALRKGARLLEAKRFEEARKALEQAERLAPDESRVQNLLGLVYFKLGLLESSKAIYDRLIESFPQEPALRVNLGLVLLRQGRLIEAERSLRSAIELTPNHKKAHAYLGLVLYRRGDYALARQHFLTGGADEFARKIEVKMRAAPRTATSQVELLKEVAERGLGTLEGKDAALSFVEPQIEERVVRDEEAWEAVVPHQARERSSLESQSPSLLPVWALDSAPPEEQNDEFEASYQAVLSQFREFLPPLEVGDGDTELPPQLDPSLLDSAAFDTAGLDLGAMSEDSEGPVEVPSALPDSASGGAPDTEIIAPTRIEPGPTAIVGPAQTTLPEAVMYAYDAEGGAAGTPSRPPDLSHVGEDSPRGFEAGPGPRARIVMDHRAHVRSRALMAASGPVEMSAASVLREGTPSLPPLGGSSAPFVRLEGPGVAHLRVRALAVALRGVFDVCVVERCLAGFDEGFRADLRSVQGMDIVWLEGQGSLLLDTEGEPMLMMVHAESPVFAAREAVLAWSTGVAPEGASGFDTRLVRFQGDGYVVVALPGSYLPSRGLR